jgi:hypothetical protein
MPLQPWSFWNSCLYSSWAEGDSAAADEVDQHLNGSSIGVIEVERDVQDLSTPVKIANVSPGEEIEVVRRFLLTSRGCQYLQETFKPVEKQVTIDVARSVPPGCKTGRFYAYYDTKSMALNRQGVWLREEDGEFDLQVGGSSSAGCLLTEDAPSKLQPSPIDARLMAFKTVANHDSIIRRLTSPQGGTTPRIKKTVSFRPDKDLVEARELDPESPSVDLVRREPSSTSVGGTPRRRISELGEGRLYDMLISRGVRPYMRVKSDHVFLAGGMLSCNDNPERQMELSIDIEVMVFDTHLAEPAALSAILGDLSSGIKDQIFTVSQGSFRLKCYSTEAESARLEMDRFFSKHGFDDNTTDSLRRPGNSTILAYFGACRPAHLRSLLRKDISLDDEDA